MTMAFLLLLLACSGPPVAVVVEYSSEADTERVLYACSVKHSDLSERYMDWLEDGKQEAAQRNVDRAVRCCTHNGGEHVAWKDGETWTHPVCLYR